MGHTSVYDIDTADRALKSNSQPHNIEHNWFMCLKYEKYTIETLFYAEL